jgi:hypothetical protein
MRLRTLTEAECYARCYGEHDDDRMNVVRLLPGEKGRFVLRGEVMRERFAERLDARGPQQEAA